MSGIAAGDLKSFKELIDLLFLLSVFALEIGYFVLAVSIDLLQELSQIVYVVDERLLSSLEFVDTVLQLSIRQ